MDLGNDQFDLIDSKTKPKFKKNKKGRRIHIPNSMKGVFWNCDGFKDPKKHKFILDLTKDTINEYYGLGMTLVLELHFSCNGSMIYSS